MVAAIGGRARARLRTRSYSGLIPALAATFLQVSTSLEMMAANSSGVVAAGLVVAAATVVLVAPEAEDLLDPVRAAIGENGAASAWSGKLVARLAARDGFDLRKSLIPALTVLAGEAGLPKTWSF